MTSGLGKARSRAKTARFLIEFLTHIVPDNVVGTFAKGELLRVVVLAVIFGMSLLALPAPHRAKVNEALDYFSELFFGFINIVMKLAQFH